MCELGAHDGRVEAAGDGGEVVQKPALSPEQGVVLDAQDAAADPGTGDRRQPVAGRDALSGDARELRARTTG